MIGWLAPLALFGLVAVAGPIVVHLLRVQRAKRIRFPSVRFVRSGQTAAVRLRLPADVWLLLVRAATVALAAAALAQPIFVTAARRAAWDQRVVRAIVVDSSESAAAAATAAQEAADAEAASASFSIRTTSAHPGRSLASAASALQTLPPGRREVVVISDFQDGTLTDADVAAVPPAVGLRFIAVGTALPRTSFDGETLLAGQSASAQRQRIALEGRRTLVSVEAVPPQIAGLRILPAADRLLRIAGTAGVPVPSSAQPIALIAAGASVPASVAPIAPGWMLRTVVRMQQDEELKAAAAQHGRASGAQGPPWTSVAFDHAGSPIVNAAAAGNDLIVGVAAPVDSFVAAAALRAALVARAAPESWTEHEVERIAPVRLAGWTRPSGPMTPDAWRQSAPGDARWLWAAALLMLGLEAVMRRRSRPAAREVHADAA